MSTEENEELKKALLKASRYCAEQDRAEFDVRRKLGDWKVPEKLHTEIIETLKKEKFIDEKRFACTFVRSKFRNNRWGRIKIAYALRQKNIPEDLIAESLKELKDEDYRRTLKELVAKKARTIKSDSDYEKKQKVAQSMASKGYETGLIYEVVFSDEEV
ncbi:MAG TPA: regulatory protein RecX [Bacteroidales bacterium]|nr:regulatory protein RecX [Bacteroidales bacterium]